MIALFPAPLAVHEYRNLRAIGADSRNVQIIGTNHEIDVCGRCIDTATAQLVLIHLVATLVALRETNSQSKMTAGVLVVQRVVKQRVALTNGRIL